jgi:hypothetical protein
MFFTKQHASVAFQDGSALSITFDDVGDWTLDGIQEAQKGTAAILHRGAFKSYVYTDQVQVTGSFSFTVKAEDFSNPSNARALDAIRKTGTWSAATTTNPGGFGPFTGKLVYTATANGQTGTLEVDYARLSVSINESGDALTGSVSFTGYLGAVT